MLDRYVPGLVRAGEAAAVLGVAALAYKITHKEHHVPALDPDPQVDATSQRSGDGDIDVRGESILFVSPPTPVASGPIVH